jgi:hypothetical protein
MTESLTDKQAWTRVGLTIGGVFLVMLAAIVISLIIA